MTAGPLNVAETEALARAVLATATYAFFAGGAADGRALRANREAFERRVLRPRVLVDVSRRTTATTVLGRPVELPVLVAPVGLQTLLHPEGELATARAAAGSGTVMCVSAISAAAPAEIAAAAPGGRLWLQIYPFRDRELTAGVAGRTTPASAAELATLVDPTLCWDDLAWLRSLSRLPLVLKGILTADD